MTCSTLSAVDLMRCVIFPYVILIIYFLSQKKYKKNSYMGMPTALMAVKCAMKPPDLSLV